VSNLLGAAPTVQREAATKEESKEKGGEEPRQTLAGIKYDQKIPVFESERKAAGYFWVQGVADLNISGTLKWGEGGVLGVGMGAEEGRTHLETEFATEFENKYGKIEAGGSADSLSVGFAGKQYGVSFKLNASLTKTLEAKFKIDVPVSDLAFGHYKFSGTATGSVTLILSPNIVRISEYVAEKGLERAAAAAAEESVTVAMEGGETVVASAGAGLAVGAGVAAAGIFAELGILYEIGRANQEGSKLGIRHSYCRGFAEELSLFTEPMDEAHPVRAYNKGQEYLLRWAMGLNWKESLQRAEKLSVDADNDRDRYTASDRAGWAWRAAVTQMVMAFIDENGGEAWKSVIALHLEKYGSSRQGREDAYYNILRRDESDEPPVIPIP
jgi:hypothetical protein